MRALITSVRGERTYGNINEFCRLAKTIALDCTPHVYSAGTIALQVVVDFVEPDVPLTVLVALRDLCKQCFNGTSTELLVIG